MNANPPSADLFNGICVLMPTYNNAGTLMEVLGRVQEVLRTAGAPAWAGLESGGPSSGPVIIVDDGSTDGTVEKIQEIMATNEHSLYLIQRRKSSYGSQRGSALRVGMEWGLQHTSHSIFVEMDGDLSHRPEDLKVGIRLIEFEEYDIAIASKYIPGSKVVNRL